jgi:hypothetical protein
MLRIRLAAALWALLALLASASAAAAQPVTVLYNGKAVTVKETLPDPNDLWTSPDDLTRINGFVLKPEGACLDDICIPIKQDQDSDLLITRAKRKWFNVTELARKLQQPFKVDHDKRVWSFGLVPKKRSTFAEDAIAPDFAMLDRKGNTVRLSDFRGKKVLLLTWASW